MVLCAFNPIFSECNNHENSSFFVKTLTNNDVKTINLIKCLKCNLSLYSIVLNDNNRNCCDCYNIEAKKAFLEMRRTYKGWLKHEKFSNKLNDQMSNYLDKLEKPQDVENINSTVTNIKAIKWMCNNAGFNQL